MVTVYSLQVTDFDRQNMRKLNEEIYQRFNLAKMEEQLFASSS